MTTSWNPTVTGLTKGNGTQTTHHVKQGRLCQLHYIFTFGSTSAVTGALTFTLPFTAMSLAAMGSAYLWDNSAGSPFLGTASLNSTTVVSIQCEASTTNFAEGRNTSSTIPFTWAVSDGVYWSMSYITV